MRKAAGEINRECLQVARSDVPKSCRMALDIGGSLAKVAYIVPGVEGADDNDARMHLLTFDLDHLDGCLTYISEIMDVSSDTVKATGVGCMKYKDKLNEALGIDLVSDDKEMEHALNGLDILWRFLSSEDLLHEECDITGLNFQRSIKDSNMGNFIFVNLGSAMTITMIGQDGKSNGIVGGSTFAGLSFLGLGFLLTQAKSFKDLVELAEGGDHRNVDLLVRDTAGCNYFSAPADSMVSSFGKAAKGTAGKKSFKDEDIASSILYAVTDNLAMQTHLVAQCQNVHHACFFGTYLSGNSSTISQIQKKFKEMCWYLKYDVKPLFLRHEGYMGVVGLLFDELFQPSEISPATNGDHS